MEKGLTVQKNRVQLFDRLNGDKETFLALQKELVELQLARALKLCDGVREQREEFTASDGTCWKVELLAVEDRKPATSCIDSTPTKPKSSEVPPTAVTAASTTPTPQSAAPTPQPVHHTTSATKPLSLPTHSVYQPLPLQTPATVTTPSPKVKRVLIIAPPTSISRTRLLPFGDWLKTLGFEVQFYDSRVDWELRGKQAGSICFWCQDDAMAAQVDLFEEDYRHLGSSVDYNYIFVCFFHSDRTALVWEETVKRSFQGKVPSGLHLNSTFQSCHYFALVTPLNPETGTKEKQLARILKEL